MIEDFTKRCKMSDIMPRIILNLVKNPIYFWA